MVTISVDDRLLGAYLFYGGILLLKMLSMSLITAFYRIKNKALPSPEDYGEKKRDEPVPINDDVERVRRAHLNDLENIPTFLIIALLFMLAGLCPTRGIWCLRIFTAARIVHTLSYLSAFSMPRGAGFLIGVVCTIVLGVSVLLSAAHAGSF
ncbi:microsomal glutathione S-transferase 1-like [Porites lutea]|uniref:microsomal glutathione S-transferase 1-like n=1 Tax=Porites lutea TaxID=51062 RepID=UPI003CC5606B